MPQFYTVSECFPNKDRNTKERIVENGQHGPVLKWLFKLKEETDSDNWMTVNRKPDNDLKPGDQLYGQIERWPNGDAKFVRMQPPRDAQPQRQSYGGQQRQATSGRDEELHQKVDFLTSLVENFLDRQERSAGAQAQRDLTPSDDDLSKPIDLSELPY